MNRRKPGAVLAAVSTALTVLATAPGLTAQDAARPFVRSSLDPVGPVTVGEPVQLEVEVFTPTWFPRAPEFPTLRVENAIVIPAGRTTNINERIQGQSWAGIRRAYTIYPQVAGDYEVPAIDIGVVYALENARPSERIPVRTSASRFSARVPPEAAGLDYFIGAEALSLAQSVDPPADTIRVGEVITRSLSASVTGALAMVIPAMRWDSVPGLTVYPNPPTASDAGGERGERIIGSRTESATYVAQEEGTYELPGVELAWWDLRARRMRAAAVPPVAFVVVPDPDYVAAFELPVEADTTAAEAEATAPAARAPWDLVIGVLAGLALVTWLGIRLGPRLREDLMERRRQQAESESAYFGRFESACQAGDARAAMRKLIEWLDRAYSTSGKPASVSDFVGHVDDPELAGAVTQLENRLYGRQSAVGSWDGSALARTVAKHRTRETGIGRGGSALAALNPG